MDIDLNALRLFVQVVQAGGYAKASRATGVPRATLSRRIAGLEEDLGLRLIERSSRSFRLTPPGEALFARGAAIVAQAQEAALALEQTQDHPQGLIRFAVAPSVLQLSLDGIIADYLAAHPRVTVQIEVTNRRIDLYREGFDFAIRAGSGRSGPMYLVVLPLAQMAHVLVAAPSWKDAVRPSLQETLETIPPLVWSASGEGARWHLQDRMGKAVSLPLTPRLAVEDMAALRTAAIAGLGITLLPHILAVPALNSGALIAPTFDLTPPDGLIHAVHLGQRGMRPVVRHLLDHLKQRYASNCTNYI